MQSEAPILHYFLDLNHGPKIRIRDAAYQDASDFVLTLSLLASVKAVG